LLRAPGFLLLKIELRREWLRAALAEYASLRAVARRLAGQHDERMRPFD
jgi:hypothetical protein